MFEIITVKITMADGTDIDNTDNARAQVGPINMPFHTMNSQVNLYLNERAVSQNYDTYPYRVVLDDYLFAANTHLLNYNSMALYAKDSAGKMDIRNPFAATDATKNNGLFTRAKYFRGSARVQMAGRFHLDLCEQERAIVSQVDVRLKITPASDAFVLMSATQNPAYKFELMDSKLLVRMVKPKSETLLAHAMTLKESPAKYPIRRKTMRMITVPAGVSEFSRDDIFQGNKPDRVIIAGVKGTAAAGSYTQNPFNFDPCQLQRLTLTVNGRPAPFAGIDINHGDNLNIEAYLGMFIGTDRTTGPGSVNITRGEFGTGYAIYCFDLTSSQQASAWYRTADADNSVNIKFNFAQGTTESYTFFILASYHNTIEINERREILLDWAA
jgi:hypothetical protein